MNLLLRLAWTLLRLFRERRLAPLGMLDEARLTLRVWPNDLDLNLHVNNGRYLTLMDLGRIYLMGRMGLLREALFNRHWMPVLAVAAIRYRRSLTLWRRFDLSTQVVGWDERWFYLEQRFEARLPGGKRELAAVALVKAAFRGEAGPVPTSELLAVAGMADAVSPELPDAMRRVAELPLA